MSQLIELIKSIVEQYWPGIAVALWNFEEGRVQQAKNEALDAKVKLELEKNHEKVDDKYRDSSDLDVVNDAIGESGSGQSITGGEGGDGTPKA